MTLSSNTPAALEDFLLQVPSMTVEQFTVVDQAVLEQHHIRKPARPLLKLGAADSSWLHKRVRQVVEPLIGSLPWPSTTLKSGAVFVVLDAAQAIIRRDRLSEEQYESFVGGFRQAGLTVPPWREPGKG